jgi:hypothetical protein
MDCCNGKHPWDEYDVERQWKPTTQRCLIVGENPGDLLKFAVILGVVIYSGGGHLYCC